MSSPSPRPAVAVAIMAKQPVPGRTKTRLSPPLSASEAAALYEAMLNDTIRLVAGVAGTQLVVAVTPASSLATWRPHLPAGAMLLGIDGPDLGACLDLTITTLLGAGFSRVIALNSDGPTLPASRIASACALLDDHEAVVGPSDDGGYYLIGLKQPQPSLFSGMPWSTADVLPITLQRAAAIGLSMSQLPGWYDVDTGEDVVRLLADLDRLPADAVLYTRTFFAWHPPSCFAPFPSDFSEFNQ